MPLGISNKSNILTYSKLGLRDSGCYDRVVLEVRQLIQETQQDAESGMCITCFI